MKKLALAVAVSSVIGATANAATVSEFSNGVLVAGALHQGSAAETTAVGLISCAPGVVYWTFFDPDTKHVTDGQFPMTKDDMYSFIWSDDKNSGVGLAGELGYLAFVFDSAGGGANFDQPNGQLDSSDAPCLAGNAFQVNLPAQDVAFIPAFPLQAHVPYLNNDLPLIQGDFGNASAGGVFVDDLTAMDEDSIRFLAAGAHWHDHIYMRYFIDGAEGGDDTQLVFWSAQDISGTYTVNMFDDNQNRKSVNFTLPRKELNIVDPEDILGRPPEFVDGFIKWDLGSPAYEATLCDDTCDVLNEWSDGVVSYSILYAPEFGAVQTLINPVQLLSLDDEPEYRVRTSSPTQPAQ